MADISESDDLTAVLESTNQKMEILEKEVYDFYVSDFFVHILKLTSPGIELKSLSYSTDKKPEGRLVVSGIAEKRDYLISFAERLGDDEIFKDVDLPITELAKNKDAEFSLVITPDM
jgi:hypothetical protein